MNDEKKTKKQLIQEVKRLRREASQFKTTTSKREELIVSTLPMVFYTAKPEDPFDGTWASSQIEGLTGFPPRQFTETPGFWSSGLHPDDRDRVFKEFENGLAKGSVTTEYRWRGAKGCLWILDHAILEKNKRGQPAKFLGAWLDISERKQAEESLRQSEQRYRVLAESAQDYIFVIDKDGYVRYVNAFAANEFGCRPEEMVGKRMHEFFPTEIAERQLKSIQETLKSGCRVLYDMLQVFPNRTVWIDTSLVPLRNEIGEADSVIGISRDISRRKEAEEKLRESESLAHRLAEENRVIAEIGRIISSTLNIEEVYNRFAELVQNLLPFDRITISLDNVEDKTVRIAHVTGMDIGTVSVGTVIPLAESLNKQLLENRRPIAIQLESEEGPSNLLPVFWLTIGPVFDR